MLNLFSKKISYFLCKEGIIQKELIDIYIYGFELIFSSCLAICLVLTLGFILNCFIESILFLICIITLRLYTGGYHANTYVGCNMLLIGSFLLCICMYTVIEELKVIWLVHIILMLINFIITFLFLPTDNKNKVLTKKEKLKCKKISFLILLFYCIIALVMAANNISLGFFVLVVLEFLFGTILIELIRRRIVKNERLFIKNCIK